MSAKTYWNLLVLFCVSCQGIIGTLLENDIDESSELLIRQKRVINRLPGGDRKEKIKDFPYVVSVRGYRSEESCVGVILSENNVLTAAKCVANGNIRYRVYSGNTQAVIPSYGTTVNHNVTNKRILRFDHPYRPDDGIALVTVNPPFRYSINTLFIQFYEGYLHPGTHCTVAGWGCNAVGDPGTAHPTYLRSIVVPIISNHDCGVLYLRTLPITESDICTLDAFGHQYCGVHDAGAPLLVQVGRGTFLVGIHLWNGGVIGRSNPDVFVNLQYPRYKNWISENMRILEASVRHQ